MKRYITAIVQMAAIAVIAFIFANMFIDGLVAEMEAKEEHARIHWRNRQ